MELLYPSADSAHKDYVDELKFMVPISNQFVAWNVVRLDTEPSKRGRPDTAPKISKAQAARERKEQEALEKLLSGSGPQPDKMQS